MRITRIPNTLALFLAVALLPLSSYASLVNYTFNGTFTTQLSDTLGLFTNKTLSGNLTYNTSTQSVSNYSIDAEGDGGWTFQSTNSPGTQGESWQFATLINNGGTISAYAGLDIFFSSPSMYRNDTYLGANGTYTYLSSGTIASTPQPVPVPPAWLMMLTGLAVLIPLYLRQRMMGVPSRSSPAQYHRHQRGRIGVNDQGHLIRGGPFLDLLLVKPKATRHMTLSRLFRRSQ